MTATLDTVHSRLNGFTHPRTPRPLAAKLGLSTPPSERTLGSLFTAPHPSADNSDHQDALLRGGSPDSAGTVVDLQDSQRLRPCDPPRFMPLPGAPGGPAGRPGVGRAGSSSSDVSGAAARHRGSSQHPSQQRRPSQRYPFSETPPPFYAPSTPDGYHPQSAGNVPQQPQQPPHFPPAALGGQYPRQQGAYVGQYTMSSQSPVPSIMQSVPQYPYSQPFHHPGVHTHASDPGMPQYHTVGYGSASLNPQMHTQAPMYQYQRYSSEGASSSGSSFSGLSHPPTGSMSYDTSPPSHSPLPAHSHTGAQAHYSGHPPPPSSFPSLHYTTVTSPAQYPPYSRESFAHSAPSVYQSQYTQPYPTYLPPTSPEDNQPHGGTWWYVPGPAASSTSSAPPAPYDSSQRQSQPYHSLYPIGPFTHVTGQADHTYATHTSPPFSPTGVPSSGLSSQLQVPSAVGPSSVASTQLDSSSRAPLSPLSFSKPSSDPSSSSHGHNQTSSSSRNPLRQAYHPTPPANRSEWVMWVGNVPSDATHDELWRFFNQPSAAAAASSPSQTSEQSRLPTGLISPVPDPQDEQVSGGVSSIFLISRSNCAFVNFDTEAHLEQAVGRFNGQQIRPNDIRCARLVCRVRRKDDDLKSGVGGQRGMGMHTRWVKEQKAKIREASGAVDTSGEASNPSSPHDQSASSLSAGIPSPSRAAQSSEDEMRFASQSPSVDTGRSSLHQSSSSGSYASTNSSFLTKNFQKRYFIMKSLTVDDLHLSVERGIWATQPHNELILNQAFRTSNDVFLIFGANKSGEFFGYARMAGPISHTEERLSWASRDSTQHSPAASISSVRRGSKVAETIPEENSPPQQPERPPQPPHAASFLLSPSEDQTVYESPQPVSTAEEKQLGHDSTVRATDFASSGSSNPGHPNSPNLTRPRLTHDIQIASAPPEMHRHHRKITYPSGLAPVAEKTLDPNALRPLETGRPASAMHLDLTDPQTLLPSLRDVVLNEETKAEEKTEPEIAKEEPAVVDVGPEEISAAPAQAVDKERPETWGTPFRVQWIRTERLPFYRTRHLRNPWNHDREVKVSRDGTEIEPHVGQALLDEWDKPEPDTPPPMSPTGMGRRGASFRPPVRPSATASPMQSQQSSAFRPRAEGLPSSRLPGGTGAGVRS